ncbi:MAG: hypothetical protein RJA81_1800 [Planctomycetota bacterium]|jgi:aspartyl-tRNA synthetase
MLKRTHNCGELKAEQVGQEVVLNGWVDAYRDFGGLVFIDLRDRYGITQVVFEPDQGEALMNVARDLRSEFCIGVKGKVTRRLEGKENPKLATGQVEIRVTEVQIFNESATPPFDIQAGDANEELRLKYRFLDLRRPDLQKIFIMRHKMNQIMRQSLSDQNFLEFETPILGRSTPEGARDFLVPSRLHKGHFYALPQSPQLYKQILMMSGMDRYFQIARCFRDEDLRANRQPEFTQLDVEMSFVQDEDVMNAMEPLVANLAKEFTGSAPDLPLPRIDYKEAMEKYGVDRPDLRFGMEIQDLADLAPRTTFQVIQIAVNNGDRVRGLCAPGGARFTRKELDELTAFVGEYGAKGLIWLKVEESGFTGPTAKFFPEDVQAELRSRFQAKPGDILFAVAGPESVTHQALSNLRIRMGSELKLYDPSSFHYSWVVRFPLLHWDAEERRYVAEHHPFTMPLSEDLPLLETDPSKVRAQAYDLVINGEECGGGTIRCHDPAIQAKIFSLLGLTPEDAQEKFGFLLSALSFGAPPHGGIALGVDRMVMLFAGLNNIRDCIAFPKTARGYDLMTGAPGEVELKQLRELYVRVVE